MNKDSFSILAFPDDETPWRINWFGEVAYFNRAVRRQQPSVLVHLSRVVTPQALTDTRLLLDPASTNHGWYSTRRHVSVGCLPYLRVGDIWQKRHLILEPEYQVERFLRLRIDSSTTSLIKAGLNKDGRGFLLPLEEHPWHRGCTKSYCIEVALDGGRRVIIPCVELIRFYFGSSSSLLSRLFLPPLLKEHLFSSYEFDGQKRRLTIKLAPGMRGVSAADIGRVCMSSYAWHSAVGVGTSLLKASTCNEPAFPIATFPFEGTTDLVASGKWVSLGGVENSTFVVFSLRSCSHPFPFASLKYELQRAQESTGGVDATAKTTLYLGPVDRNKHALAERDASNRLSEKAQEISFEHRFPDLAKKCVWKEKESMAEGVSSIVREKGISSITQGAVGEPGSEQPIRPVEMEIKPKEECKLPEFMRQVAEELNRMKPVRFRLLTSGGSDGWTVPVSHRNMADSRLYIEAKNNQPRLRRIGAFRIHGSTSALYLALVESAPFCPFFIDMPESAQDKFLSIASHQFLLWHSARIPDPDPFGFRLVQNKMHAELQSLIEFLVPRIDAARQAKLA